MNAPRWKRITLLCIALCAAVALALYGAQVVQHAKIRQRTRENFGLMWCGLAWYSTLHGRLPQLTGTATRADRDEQVRTSWRVSIVPCLMSWHGSWDARKAWHDPANRELLELSGFYCYDRYFAKKAIDLPGVSFPDTNAVAIVGPGTAFGDESEPSRALNTLPANTVLIVESRQSKIPWPTPGDFDVRTLPHTIGLDGHGISGNPPGAFAVLFADGQVWCLSERVPFEALAKFFTIESAQRHDRESLLGPFVLPGARSRIEP